jgi:hypothetical protein
MRVYIIGNDGITLCRRAPATVNDGEIAVAANEELALGDGGEFSLGVNEVKPLSRCAPGSRRNQHSYSLGVLGIVSRRLRRSLCILENRVRPPTVTVWFLIDIDKPELSLLQPTRISRC